MDKEELTLIGAGFLGGILTAFCIQHFYTKHNPLPIASINSTATPLPVVTPPVVTPSPVTPPPVIKPLPAVTPLVATPPVVIPPPVVKPHIPNQFTGYYFSPPFIENKNKRGGNATFVYDETNNLWYKPIANDNRFYYIDRYSKTDSEAEMHFTHRTLTVHTKQKIKYSFKENTATLCDLDDKIIESFSME